MAELLIWRKVINGYVIGTIYNSSDPEFPNGKRSTWQFRQIIEYPALTDYWDHHIILQWWNGKYLMADYKHMEKLIQSQQSKDLLL